MVDRYVSGPIELAPAAATGDYARADLIFDDVDHSLASYEGRVYINAPDATLSAGRDHPAYAGSFHIFGHGGCFGDVGHCDVPAGPRDPFDLRSPHQLSPVTKVVIVTDALKRVISSAADTSSVQVTVVVAAAGKPSNEYLEFSRLRLLTYR
jgi:tyrosinase